MIILGCAFELDEEEDADVDVGVEGEERYL